jgi:hypothetical protein
MHVYIHTYTKIKSGSKIEIRESQINGRSNSKYKPLCFAFVNVQPLLGYEESEEVLQKWNGGWNLRGSL